MYKDTNKTIHAHVDAKALDKVTRFFNATVSDILNELLQNARRANATAVHITTDVSGDTPTMTIADNGDGIHNPQQLLSLGCSGWERGVQCREDPAGMGLFSLANRGALIESKDWKVALHPDHFSGKVGAQLHSTTSIQGTRITFPLLEQEQGLSTLSDLIEAASYYYPLPVTLNERQLEQGDFLTKAVYVEEWNGIRIGVIPSHYNRVGYQSINFHGLLIPQSLPKIMHFDCFQSSNCEWRIRLDIVNCPNLKLVLPARKELVQDSFFHSLVKECQRVMFRYIKTLNSHTLNFKQWSEARTLGIDLPEAVSELHIFRPRTHDESLSDTTIESVSTDSVLLTVFNDEDTVTEHCFQQAIEQKDSPLHTLKLFQQYGRYEGYRWYDRRKRITSINFTPSAEDTSGYADALVDRIDMDISIEQQGAKPVNVTSKTPIWIESEFYCDWWDTRIWLAKEHGFTPESLIDFLECSGFHPSEDWNADSYETQREMFLTNATERAFSLLVSKEAALRERIIQTASEHLRWSMPTHSVALIRVSNDSVTVKLCHKS